MLLNPNAEEPLSHPYTLDPILLMKKHLDMCNNHNTSTRGYQSIINILQQQNLYFPFPIAL